MFPLILLAYVVAVKVFKKSAPNGKLTVYLGKIIIIIIIIVVFVK